MKSGVWLLLKRKLERQQFKCAYSGLPIMPGVNASLDHIVPRIKGGTSDMSNLHWVDLTVNKMKGCMLLDDFVALCKTIVEWGAGL